MLTMSPSHQFSRSGDAVDDFFVDRHAGTAGKGGYCDGYAVTRKRYGVALRKKPINHLIDFGLVIPVRMFFSMS